MMYDMNKYINDEKKATYANALLGDVNKITYSNYDDRENVRVVQGYIPVTDSKNGVNSRPFQVIAYPDRMTIDRYGSNAYDFGMHVTLDNDQKQYVSITHCVDFDAMGNNHLHMITIDPTGKLVHMTQQKYVNAEGKLDYKFVTDYEMEGMQLGKEELRDLMENGEYSETFNKMIGNTNTRSRGYINVTALVLSLLGFISLSSILMLILK